jgi:hypothetical protein
MDECDIEGEVDWLTGEYTGKKERLKNALSEISGRRGGDLNG